MTDLFEKSLSELKLPAYAAELNKAYDVPKPPPLPKLPSVTSDRTQSSALNTAVDLILSKRTKAAAKAGIAPDILVASVPAFNGGADFANLSYEEQSKRYNEFMTTQLTALKAANPKADDLALEDAFKSKNPPPIDPTGGKGDFARGLAQYIPQTKGMLQGAAGLLLKKVGADESGDALLKDAQASSDESGKLALKNDSFTEALKPGGSLIDWAQYTAGSLTGNLLESFATAGVGALVGGASTGGVGALPGGAAGFVAKSLVKKTLREAIEVELEATVKSQVAKGLTREAALKIAQKQADKKLVQAASKAAGATTAMLTASGTRGVGEIVQQAQQAGLSPEEISTFDIATGAGVYALAETVSDKLMLGSFMKPGTRGVVGRTAIGALETAIPEGLTEVAQDSAVGLAAGTGLQTPEQALNAFAAGFVGGGTVGGTGAIVSGQKAPAKPTPSPTDQLTSTEDTAPVRPAAGTLTDLDGTGTMGVYRADGSLAYAEGQTPTPVADALIAASQPAVAAPAQPVAQAAPAAPIPGTTSMVGGSQIILGTDGLWDYADGAERNPVANAEIVMRNVGIQTAPTENTNAPAADNAQVTTSDPQTSTLPAAVETANADLRQNVVPSLASQPNRFVAISSIASALNQLSPADRQALNQLAAETTQPVSPQENPLLFAVRELGLNRRADDALEGEQWARNLRNEAPIFQTLQRMEETPQFVGTVNAYIAGAIRQLYRVSGTALPGVAFIPAPTQGELGSYNPSRHLLTFNPTTTANTVLHENIHALTTRGLRQLEQATDQRSRDVIALLDAMLAKLRAAGQTRGTADRHEMLAELVRPEFLALAANTLFDYNALSPEAKRGFDIIGANASANASLIEIISDFIAYVLRTIDPISRVDSASVLNVLTQAAATLTSMNGTAPVSSTANTPNTTALGSRIYNSAARQEVIQLARTLQMERAADPSRIQSDRQARDFFSLIEEFNQDSITASDATTIRRYNNGLTTFSDLLAYFTGLPERTNTAVDPNPITAAEAQRISPAGLPEGSQVRPPNADQGMNIWSVVLPTMVRGRNLVYGTTREEAVTNAIALVQSQSPDSNVNTPNATPTGWGRAETATPQIPQLPADLRGASPRAGNAILNFASDIDLAFMIVLRNTSRRRADYRAWLNQLGYTDSMIESARNTFNSRLRMNTQGRSGNVSIPQIIRNVRNGANPAPAQRTSAVAPTQYSPEIFNSLRNFALTRGERGIFRGVPPSGALGQLVPITANATERIGHFWQAMRDGIAALNNNPRFTGQFRITPDNTITFNNRRIGLGLAGTVSGVPTFAAETTSFDTGSSAGGAFYDVLNGAIVSSRSKIYNGSLTNVNTIRLPINRLRAMLKWGALTNNFIGAVEGLAPNGTDAPTVAGKFINLLKKVAEKAQANLQPAVGTGRILYNPETNRIEVGDQSYTFAELKPLTQVNSRSDQAQASASTPDTIALTGLANALQDAGSPEAQQRVLDAAFGGGDNSLFGTVFSLPDDNESLADLVFSKADQEVQAADNIVPSDVIPNQRINYTQLQESIANGEQAAPVSPSSEMRQAARRGDWQGVRHALSGAGKWLNQKLHDHLVPMVDWINDLPVPDALKASINAALYRAPGVRDFLLNDAMANYGGQDLNKLLADFSTKYGITAETAARDAGYWATATRAPEGNAILLQRDSDAIVEAQRKLADGTGSQAEVNAAVAQFVARHAAINNAQTKVKVHGGDGVAGFNNAQARLLLNTLEAKYSKEDMKAIADKLQLLNAWRLATDIETGKTSPATAAAFLRQPELLPLLKELRDMGATATATEADQIAALEAKRKEVINAVKSNYVPLSGNPNQAQADNIFYSGGRQPNVSRDYRMGGRTTSIPDDAVSATLAAVIKTASYGGWRDFQDGIADAYAAMTPDQREQAGIYRTSVTDRSPIPAGSIVRRRNGQTAAYHLRDEKLLESVRGSNFEDNGNMFLSGMGKFTKLYSYLATQIAPWFAPKNFIRDFWDRSELIRTRKYLDANGVEVDSTKVARHMLSYMGNPAKLATLMKATQKNAFGIDGSKSLESRYLDEMLRLGGGSIFGDRFTANRADLIEAILTEKNGFKQVAKLKEYVAKYNRMFDLGPSLAAYIALRENGVPAARAAGGALDLMNFRKRGENSAILSAFYAFAQPAITSGVNTFSSLGTRRGQIRLAAYTVGLMGLQAFLRGLADDDEGGNKLDQQSDFLQNTHLLVPFGNGIIKIPLAFGLVRIANSMARASISVGTDNLTLKEAGGDLVSGGIVPVISPIEDVNIPWDTHPVQAFGMTFAPTWIKPLLAVGFNQTPWGTAITNDKYEDTQQYKSEQFGKGVSPTYKEIAVFLRENMGVDMSPEDVKYLIKGYPLGPGTMLVNGFVENPYKESKGRAVENPALQQVYAGYSEAAIYFQFKDALTKTDALLKEVNVGNSDFTPEQRAMLDWRKRWDKTDDALNAAKAKVTKDKTLSESGKQTRKDAIQRTREQATALALFQYRTAIGLPATRTEAWSPK